MKFIFDNTVFIKAFFPFLYHGMKTNFLHFFLSLVLNKPVKRRDNNGI